MSSKCPNPNCNSTNFETVIETPKDSRFKLQFVRCSGCKTVVGTMDYYNIGSLVYRLAEKLRIKL